MTLTTAPPPTISLKVTLDLRAHEKLVEAALERGMCPGEYVARLLEELAR